MTTAYNAQLLGTVKAELAELAVPTPEDILSEMSPLARLYFVEQCAWELLSSYAAQLADVANDEEVEASAASDVLQQLSFAAASLDQALVSFGVLPAEAAS